MFGLQRFRMGYNRAGLLLFCGVLVWLEASFGILWTGAVCAGESETIPTYHWVYDYLAELRLRGYFAKLWELQKPYTRGEVAMLLLAAQPDSSRAASAHISRLLEKLKQEFAVEMAALQDEAEHCDAELRLVGINEYRDDGNIDVFHGLNRGKIGLRLSQNIGIYDALLLDNRLDEDPTYLGKHQSGFGSYSEQAYGRLRAGKFQFVFGRDFVLWGPETDYPLLFSDNSRPLDHFSACYTGRFFRLAFLTASLDPMSVTSGEPGLYRRYLSAHRIDVRLGDFLNVGISEAIIFGAHNPGLELAYLNPFIFYHGVQLNGPAIGNTLGTLDWSLYPLTGLNFYGQFLLDDVQLEHSVVGDLEPNEIGYIVGIRFAGPLSLPGLEIGGEYTRVTNRTYKTSSPWERWVHRNQPMAHPLGNDFDRLLLSAKVWPLPDFQVGVKYERIRRGEGRIDTPFDTPWVDYTIEEGYSEPFPTGVVEKTTRWSFWFRYHPFLPVRLFWSADYNDVTNVENQLGVGDSYWRISTGIWFDVGLRFKL